MCVDALCVGVCVYHKIAKNRRANIIKERERKREAEA